MLFKVFLITFVIVVIFRKTNDTSDLECDPKDDSNPIYLDKSIPNINEGIKRLEVKYLN